MGKPTGFIEIKYKKWPKRPVAERLHMVRAGAARHEHDSRIRCCDDLSDSERRTCEVDRNIDAVGFEDAEHRRDGYGALGQEQTDAVVAICSQIAQQPGDLVAGFL